MSDLIDVANCDEPRYGKLHTSLYMAIMKDALDRALQLKWTKEEIERPRSNQGTEEGIDDSGETLRARRSGGTVSIQKT